MEWNEQDHPRDDDGKFTFKEGGILKGSIEKTKNNDGILGKLLGGYSLGEIKDILLSVISTAAPSIIKTGLTIAQMKNFIKLNNLEKELIKKIENIKTNKGIKEIKRKSQGDKNNSSNLISLGNSSNNLTNNRIKSKIKETPKDILFASSNTNNQLKLKQDDYKSKLLDILGNHATQGDVLYGKPEELEKKVRDLGLGSKLKNAENTLRTDFQKDKNKHEILRQFSVYCYDNNKQNIPNGYKRIGHFYGKNNGFDAVVAENSNTKEIVIAYRGMELGTMDVPSTIRVINQKYTSQIKDAQAVYDKIKNTPIYKDYQIYTTGQSLGGYLAQYVAAKNNLKSATFNAFHGTNDVFRKEFGSNKKDIEIYPENIVNYRNSEDYLTVGSHKNDVGLSLETKAIIREKGFDQFHKAENMGDLNKAIIKNANFNKH